MELKNFGSILSFAAELEAGDGEFYRSASQNPLCQLHKDLFEGLYKEHKQNEQKILRIRRENVTEMILEPIKNFTKLAFVVKYTAIELANVEEVLKTAKKLEKRSEQYFLEAAEKIKALPEVSRELKRIGEKHTIHREKLPNL